MQRQHAYDVDPTNGGADDFPDADAAGSRRALLGTAAAGFALAASGLLLPDWLVEEAEAESHPNHPVRRIQHRADKRRQRKRHRLKQNRAQNNSSNQDNPPPGDFVRYVAVFVHNNAAISQVLKVQAWKHYETWIRDNGPNHPEEWVILPGQSFVDFFERASNVAICIDSNGEQRSFWFQNPSVGYPSVDGYFGGWDANGKQGNAFQSFTLSQKQEKDMSTSIGNFHFTRFTDISEYERFQIDWYGRG